MPYYKTLQRTTSNLLGNKLAKKYGLNKEFTIHKTKQKLQIITDNSVAYIIYDDHIIPCIQYAQANHLVKKIVHLDDKALKPILGGADVMAPGVYKYIERCDDFSKGDVVFIEIEGEIIGVGIALTGKNEIVAESRGVIIEVWQRKGDWASHFI